MKRTPLASCFSVWPRRPRPRRPRKPARKPVAPPPKATPTPGILSRIDPDVVEETDTYVIRRYPKDKYVKTDDRHIKHPNLAQPVEFFKEDDKYYYISQSQGDPGREGAQGVLRTDARSRRGSRSEDGRRPRPAPLGGRDGGGLRRSPSPARGRPPQARARLGDGPAELGSVARVLRDRRHERRQEGRHRRAPGAHRRRPAPRLARRRQGGLLGVAADVHRRGQAGEGLARLRRRGGRGTSTGTARMDVVSASHGGGLVLRVRRRQGRVRGRPDRAFPQRDYSSQAIVLLRRQRRREARHRGLPRLDGGQEGRGRRPDAGPRLPVPGPRQGLGVEEGRHRRGLLLEQPERLGLRRRREEGRADRQPLHGRADASLEKRRRRHLLAGPVRRDRAVLVPFRDGARARSARRERRPTPTPTRCRPTFRRTSEGQRDSSIYTFENGTWSRHRVWRQKEWKSYLFGLAFGDLDERRPRRPALRGQRPAASVRVLFQKPDGTFVEAAEAEEPALDSPGQTLRLADVNGDGDNGLWCRRRWRLRTPRRRAAGMCT